VKVQFSKEAENDLLGIGDYIAKESPLRALEFVRGLRAVRHSSRKHRLPILLFRDFRAWKSGGESFETT
jgi:hypothetical protein